MIRVLLVEPWLAGSHQAWAEGFQRHSRNEVRIVGLPGEQWRWNLRAGALSLAERVAAEIASFGQPDVLVVSGLVDVSSLLGFLRGRLDPAIPVVTYMHESQVLYPTVSGNVDADSVLRNWHSWCASDLVLFNSSFHLDSVNATMPRWLADLPPFVEGEQWAPTSKRFEVMTVGVEPRRPTAEVSNDRPVILWPHRWEPDKRPDVFARAVDKLAQAGLDFRLVLAGELPSPSAARKRLERDHGRSILAAGPFSATEYGDWLERSDMVVSCAEHEFFGIAIVEAILAGCVPVVPEALSYPEVIPKRFHEAVLYPPGRFGSRLVEVVSDLSTFRRGTEGLAHAIPHLTWPETGPRFDTRLELLCSTLGR